MLDLEVYKRTLDLEFRAQWRDSLLTLELPVHERVETSRALAGLVYQGVDGRRSAHHLFQFTGAPGKFRLGDYALMSPADPEPRGMRVRSGMPVVIDRIEEGRLIISGPRNSPDAGWMAGRSYVLDERPPNWFPNFQRLSFALALSEFCREPGERLRSLIDGSLAIDTVDAHQTAPEDLEGERAREAFTMAISRNLAAVQGPPGTGKTYLLARVARELVRRGLRVVLCGFTHRAINNALGAMVQAGIPVDRLGKVTGSDESDLPEGIQALDKKTYWEHPKPGFVAAMTVHAAFEPFSRPLTMNMHRAKLGRPDREGMSEADFWKALDRFNREVVQTAKLPGPKALADVVLFDESGQLTVPMALCGLAIAPRAVFFGDHAQLPPVNPIEAHEGHASIFHLIAKKYPQAMVRLNQTYRMNEELCAFPAGAFYGGDLASSPGSAARSLDGLTLTEAHARVLAPKPASQLVLVEHRGQGQESPAEAAVAADLALTLIAQGLDARNGLAIMAPHRRQNNAIRSALDRLARARGVDVPAGLVVDTVDRMQGQERDVILFSLTASDDDVLESEREFLFLPNRFNVAITRARKKLIVIGSRAYFHHLPHALLHARWAGDDGRRARQMLDEANTFKRWYLAHRESAIDLTRHAEGLLAATVV